MDRELQLADETTLLDHVRVLRRRKWIALQAVVLVPVAAVLFSLTQARVYQAEADVLISNRDLAAALTGTQQQAGVSQTADRIAQTQADLARVPVVAQRALVALRLTDRTPQDLLDHSSVTPKTNADLLEFKVSDRDPRLASMLASEYARQFRLYRQDLDTAALRRAGKEVQDRMGQLRAAGRDGSALYANLAAKDQQLATLAALQTSNTYVVRWAGKADRIQPRPVRNGLLGLLLGLVLGVGLAFLWDALDTHVRSPEEISGRLGLPLLGRLPAPPKRLRGEDRLVMLEEPGGPESELFRMLRTSIEFANLERGARTIMVTSAVEGEGKSTTAANLAVAFARAGKRVVLVDLDLRKPFVHRLVGVPLKPGVADVALGAVDLAAAVRPVAVGERPRLGGGNGDGRSQGLLEVLAAGTLPPDPGEFLSTHALGSVLERLHSRVDVVVVDAPPLLHIGDAMTLSAHVDAVLLVARLQTMRRPMLAELGTLLARLPAPTLGFVATGAELGGEYGYAYATYGTPATSHAARAGQPVP